MTILNTLGQTYLVSQINAWAGVPATLTEQNPISYRNGIETCLLDRLASFTANVRSYEACLLETLGVAQSKVDRFMGQTNQYGLLLWQLPLPWVQQDRAIAAQVIKDMEGIGAGLRKLEKEVERQKALTHNSSEEGCPQTLWDETKKLRRHIAARSSYAEEVLVLLQAEPAEGVAAFYSEPMRRLRSFDSSTVSMEIYFKRRPSYRPPASI